MIRLIPTIHEPVVPPPDTPRRNANLAWTPRERQVLRERYIAEGASACKALLPARTRTAILAEAARLGLKRQKPHRPWAPSTPQIDDAIRAVYDSGRPWGACRELAKRLGRPVRWVTERAAQLGVARPKRPISTAWTPAEDALLEDLLERRIQPTAMARAFRLRGYHRTGGAIGQRARALRLRMPSDPDTWTASELAACMGVSDQTVLVWIRRAGLPAVRADDGRIWQIHRPRLREWLIRSAEWDHRRCAREWLLDILVSPVPQRRQREAA